MYEGTYRLQARRVPTGRTDVYLRADMNKLLVYHVYYVENGISTVQSIDRLSDLRVKGDVMLWYRVALSSDGDNKMYKNINVSVKCINVIW